ncbi:MAG: A1S_2505 family phage non-structural protein [Polaromonas sp.]
MQILNKHHFHGRPMPMGSVYVGRGSALGNPFVIGEHGTREEVIAAYGAWLDAEIAKRNPVVLTALAGLREDSSLLCYCTPAPCHAEKIRDAWLRLRANGGVNPKPKFHDDGAVPRNGEVFVFGSNLAGRHGAGAAAVARDKFGALPGVGVGYAGAAPAHSWAIPTKDVRISTLPLDVVRPYIEQFALDTQGNPDKLYFVTRVGCGLAGNKDADVAPMFLASAIGRCSFALDWAPHLGQRSMCYAGIGSRATPPEVLHRMTRIAERLEARGYTLRSGAAAGADAAFENGALSKQIFLPWAGFNGNASPLDHPTDEAIGVAKVVHPAFDRLADAAVRLISRNSHQILGQNLDAPVDFVVCWTPDGAETEAQRSQVSGGTGQAIALASRWNIPVFNLANQDALQRIAALLG